MVNMGKKDIYPSEGLHWKQRLSDYLQCMKNSVEFWPNKNSDLTYSIRIGTYFKPKDVLTKPKAS
jgi:hypothetical protein